MVLITYIQFRDAGSQLTYKPKTNLELPLNLTYNTLLHGSKCKLLYYYLQCDL